MYLLEAAFREHNACSVLLPVFITLQTRYMVCFNFNLNKHLITAFGIKELLRLLPKCSVRCCHG